ncbi:hypothetical protein Tco_1265739 [Tanacetum coccineum]
MSCHPTPIDDFTSDGTLNEVTPDSGAIMEGVTPSMVDMDVEKEKLCSLEDTTILGSFPPLYEGLLYSVVICPGNSMEGLDAMLENGLWSSFARVMIELRADVELKDNIIVAMPRIKGGGNYICNVCVKYEWKPPRVGEKKTLKKPSQTSRAVIRIKKKGVEHTIEVSNSNPFEVLNSVDNDVELGTNVNVVNNRATSNGSSFMNVDNSSTGTTLIIEKIRKFEELLTSRKAILVDEAGNPLKKIKFPGDYDSEDEVESVNNDMARSLASKRVGLAITFAGLMGYLYGNG